MNWINELIDEYYRFLRRKIKISENISGEWIEISTPFTDVFNDTIELYAKKNNGKIILSDDGATLRNLELSGVDISRSVKKKKCLKKY